MSTVITESYADQDMQCPPGWQNGYKPGWVKSFGDCERALSNARTGTWTGSSTTVKLLDPTRRFRGQLASTVDRYWIEPWEIKMTSRENRAILGIPWTVFVGLVSKITLTSPLGLDVQLADLVGKTILTDESKIPWRRVQDSFLDYLTTVAADFQRDEQGEPILYGIMDKPFGGYAPPYLGKEPIGGVSYHVWEVAGHAIADIPQWYVNGVAQSQGTTWLVPHYSNWTTQFGAHYVDRASFTFPATTRRYTLIYGKVGETAPDAAAEAGVGQAGLTINFKGTEPNGDGTGTVITDGFEQFKHFLINYVVNAGEQSYQSGAWLTSPSFTLWDESAPMVDEPSFDTCAAIAIERYPPTGYVRTAVIGATAADRRGARDWIKEFTLSNDCRFGVSRLGQLFVCMLHPTAAIKAAAPIYTDAYEILRGSFETDLRWDEQANDLIFSASYNWATNVYDGAGESAEATSITGYAQRIFGPQVKYLFIPTVAMALHVSQVEVVRVAYPPKVVRLEQSITRDTHVPAPLATQELGDYIQYVHFAEVGTPGQVRLAQIERIIVSPSGRKVRVDAVDCEDLIDYDVFDAQGGNAFASSPIAQVPAVGFPPNPIWQTV